MRGIPGSAVVVVTLSGMTWEAMARVPASPLFEFNPPGQWWSEVTSSGGRRNSRNRWALSPGRRQPEYFPERRRDSLGNRSRKNAGGTGTGGGDTLRAQGLQPGRRVTAWESPGPPLRPVVSWQALQPGSRRGCSLFRNLVLPWEGEVRF